MKVVEFKGSGISPQEAVEVLDQLRADIVAGKVVCFAAVGIDKDDGTTMWMGNVGKKKTNLQLLGALENLKLHFWNGDIK